MVDDVFQLPGRGVAAARDADGAEGDQGEVGDDPGVTVVGEEEDLGPLADLFVGKSPGEQQDIFVELAVGDDMLFTGSAVNKSFTFRVQMIGAQQDIMQ